MTLDPLDFDALCNLGVVLAESPEPRKALPYLNWFVAGAPPERYGSQIARAAGLIERIERH